MRIASQNGLKGKNTRLEHQSEQFWVAEKSATKALQRGWGAKAPPFVGVCAPKILRTAA